MRFEREIRLEKEMGLVRDLGSKGKWS